MRSLFLTFSILGFLVISASGQLAKPSAADEREANALAAAFFNRYQETMDVTPLVKEYFITDFGRRAKFCYTTGKCSGFGKDFWNRVEGLEGLDPSESDFEALYANGANYFFLYSQILRLFGLSSGVKPEQIDEDLVRKFVSDKLDQSLRNQPEILKLSDPDDPFPEFKTLTQFRQYLGNYRLYLSALRSVESTLRLDVKESKPTASTLFTPNDFESLLSDNETPFFGYPKKTRFVEVSPRPETSMLLTLDLLRVGGQLKIVAAYMPMD